MKRKKELDGVQNKRLERDAEGFKLLYNIGVKCIQRENYEGAIKVLTSAMKYNPNSSDAWYQLGNAYMGAGQYQEAISPLRKATALNQAFTDAWYKLGSSYMETGQYELAIEPLEKAVNLEPKYCEILASQEDSGEDSDQENALEREFNPKYIIALSDLGIACAEVEQYEKAINCLEEATKLDSVLCLSWYELGNAYVKTKQYEKAIEPLEKAIKLDANFAVAKCKLSEANIKSALNKAGTPLPLEILEIVVDYSGPEVLGDCNEFN